MASSPRTPLTRAQLQDKRLRAEIRRHNAHASFYELKAANERWLQEKEWASADEHRIYNFVLPVVPETVQHCIDTITHWSRLDEGCDIKVVLNSPGGYITDGLALYDTFTELKEKGHKLTIVVRGEAASMAGIILQAASEGERIVGRNAYVMIHELADIVSGKHSTMKDAVKFNESLLDRLVGILAERSTMTPRQIKNKMDRRDWWLDAPEAVKLGFADHTG